MNITIRIQTIAVVVLLVILSGMAHAWDGRLVRSGSTYVQSLEDNLRRASSQGDLDEIKKVLGAGARIDSSDIDGYTPLICDVGADQPDAVSLLLQWGADVNRKAEKTGHTALTWAAVLGYRHLVDMLVAAGADVELRNKRERTPLMEASLRGYESTTRSLLAKGADPNAKDRRGRTALALATGAGHRETTAFLVAGGAVTDDTTRRILSRVRSDSLHNRRVLARGSDMVMSGLNYLSADNGTRFHRGFYTSRLDKLQTHVKTLGIPTNASIHTSLVTGELQEVVSVRKQAEVSGPVNRAALSGLSCGGTGRDYQDLQHLAAQAASILQQTQSQYLEVASPLPSHAPQFVQLVSH